MSLRVPTMGENQKEQNPKCVISDTLTINNVTRMPQSLSSFLIHLVFSTFNPLLKDERSLWE